MFQTFRGFLCAFVCVCAVHTRLGCVCVRERECACFIVGSHTGSQLSLTAVPFAVHSDTMMFRVCEAYMYPSSGYSLNNPSLAHVAQQEIITRLYKGHKVPSKPDYVCKKKFCEVSLVTTYIAYRFICHSDSTLIKIVEFKIERG